MALVTTPDASEPEARHRGCWYGRRTPHLPAVLTIHTIEDGELLYCAHPMFFPIVGFVRPLAPVRPQLTMVSLVPVVGRAADGCLQKLPRLS
jgi:hypothetical protein